MWCCGCGHRREHLILVVRFLRNKQKSILKHSDPRAIFCNTIHIGSTENAGPENGGPKKMKELKMQD